MADELSDVDRAILDFETVATWWKYAGSKEAEIRERFDLTPTAYYQRLNQLVADPLAEAYAPRTVARLVKMRDRRAAAAARFPKPAP